MAVAMDLAYRREGHRSFTDTVEAVERSVRSHGFDVVRRHDLQATLAAKGFEIQPLVVLDVSVSGKSTDMVKMHVYLEDGAVWVSAIRPGVLWPDDGDGSGVPEPPADDSVRSLVDAACV